MPEGTGKRRRTPSHRRWALTHHVSLLAPLVAVLVVWVLLAGSVFGGVLVSTLSWRAPYTGNTSTGHKVQHLGCTSHAIAAPQFDPTNGSVLGGAGVKASSCTSSNTGTSDAYINGSAELELPSFTGRSGTFNASLKWTPSFKLTLDMAGTTCSAAGQLDSTNIDFVLTVLNVTSDKPLVMKVMPFSHELFGAASYAKSHINNFTEVKQVHLDASDSYSVVAALGFSVQVDVNNPTTGNPQSCTATADVTSLGGGVLATLDVARVF